MNKKVIILLTLFFIAKAVIYQTDPDNRVQLKISFKTHTTLTDAGHELGMFVKIIKEYYVMTDWFYLEGPFEYNTEYT